jgi:hypothetical protein
MIKIHQFSIARFNYYDYTSYAFYLFIYLNKGNEGQLTASDTCLYIIEKCCGIRRNIFVEFGWYQKKLAYENKRKRSMVPEKDCRWD